MDFGELKNDTDFIEKVTNVDEVLKKIEKNIGDACAIKNYDTLTMEDKVKYDLYLSYSINSLYWMYLKLQGVDSKEVIYLWIINYY